MLLVFLTGCSGLRKLRMSEKSARGTSELLLYSDILSNNLTEGGFFIRRLQIEFSVYKNKPQSFTGNLRVNTEGKWLLSVRSIGGIEVVRIMADKNEVIILDRLVREAHILKWEELKSQYGISYGLLPLIFGDLPYMDDGAFQLKCGSSNIIPYERKTLLFFPDCNYIKARKIQILDAAVKDEVSFEFLGFQRNGDKIVPSDITGSEMGSGLFFNLSFKDILLPWDETLTFNIPANYHINR